MFYTDGMTEYGRDILAGEARLLESFLETCASENPAASLQETIFSSRENRDDAATLALASFEGVVPDRLRFSAIPLAAPIIRSIMNRFCDQERLDDDQRFSVITAVGEAVANAIEHAYGGEDTGVLEIRLDGNPQQISIEIHDRGRWRKFRRNDERGRGIILMHELMDRVRISSAQTGTILTLLLRRNSAVSET